MIQTTDRHRFNRNNSLQKTLTFVVLVLYSSMCFLILWGIRIAVSVRFIDLIPLSPESGLLLAGFLLFSFKYWPFLILLLGGAIIGVDHVTSQFDSPIYSQTLIFFITTLLSAVLIKHFFNGANFLDRTRHTVGFVASSAVGGITYALLSVILITSFNGTDFNFSMIAYKFLSVFSGYLFLTPFVLSLVSVWKQPCILNKREYLLVEVTLFLLLFIFTAWLIIRIEPESVRLVYLVFPFVIFGVFRFGVLGGTFPLVLFSAFVLFRIQMLPRYQAAKVQVISQELLILQVFMLVVAFTTLFLIAMQSERIRVQEDLEEKEERLRLANQAVNDGIWDWHLPTGKTFVTDRCYHMLGFRREDYPPSFITLIRLLHPDDRWKTFEHIKAAMATGKRLDLFVRFLTKWESYRWIHLRGQCVSYDDRKKPVRLAGTINDIDREMEAKKALARSEEEKKIILEHIPDTILYLDKQMHIVWINRHPRDRIDKSTDPNTLIGKTCFEAIFNKEKPCNDCPMIACLVSNSPQSAELSFEKNQYYQVYANPVFNTDHLLVGGVVYLQNLTQTRSLQKQLLQAQKMEAIGLLASGVAHDFNNILQLMLGYSELMQMELSKTSFASREYIDHIINSAHQGKSTVKQLLAFSRKDTRLNKAIVNINSSVHNLLNLINRLIGDHILITFNPGEDLPDVKADGGQLEQVLLNLCMNAKDAMPNGGELTLTTSSTYITSSHSQHYDLPPGPYILCSVSDTGMGIKKEIQERIFEPFFTTKKERGTGLGLSMAYGIIRNHDGAIHVYSEENKGTTFRIYLPVQTNIPEPDSVAAESEISIIPDGQVILLAEDEKEVAQYANTMLQEAGFRIVLVHDGKQAIQAFNRYSDKIDLVLLDVIMPNITGIQAARYIRKISENIPILFCTGYDSEIVKGCDPEQIIEKPFEKSVLMKKIAMALKKTQQEV